MLPESEERLCLLPRLRVLPESEEDCVCYQVTSVTGE